MKKFLLVLPLFAVLALVPVSTAEAQDRYSPNAGHTHHDCYYKVYYRTCAHSPWRCYGTYDCPHAARRISQRFHHIGYEVYTRTVH